MDRMYKAEIKSRDSEQKQKTIDWEKEYRTHQSDLPASSSRSADQSHRPESRRLKKSSAEKFVDIDQYFKDEFVRLSGVPLSDLPASFNRRLSVKDMKNDGQKVALAYAEARGLALKKKAEQTPWEDTTKAFYDRYEVKVDRLWNDEDARKDFIQVQVYVRNPSDGPQLPTYMRHCYENVLNVTTGEYIFSVNYGDRDQMYHLPGTSRLQMNHILWHSRANAIAELEMWDIKGIASRPITKMTLDRVINPEADEVWHSLVKPALSGKERVEFSKGEQFYTIFIGTPVIQAALYFCEQYKSKIGHHEIKKIVIPNKEQNLQKVELYFGPIDDLH